MLALLINVNIGPLDYVWGVTIAFLTLAVLLCLGLTIRRFSRNRQAILRKKHRVIFQRYLSDLLKCEKPEIPVFENTPDCHISDMAGVFLHYFQTLKGEKFEHLQDLISGSHIENEIIESSLKGTRGHRMQAVKTLSYLNSQSSLHKIHSHLSSEDKYIRLTAVRCLVRRKSLFFLNAIIEACLDGFPNDHKLLADILSQFGKDAVVQLENVVKTTEDETSIAACLEALVIIMPAATSLDFKALMEHSSPAVRSATVALSGVVSYSNTIDPLRQGLADEDVSVQIRAAKTACHLKRNDLTSELYALSSSSVMWLRYWSFRAIWASSQQGEKFVASLSGTHPMAADVALEMRSGYV